MKKILVTLGTASLLGSATLITGTAFTASTQDQKDLQDYNPARDIIRKITTTPHYDQPMFVVARGGVNMNLNSSNITLIKILKEGLLKNISNLSTCDLQYLSFAPKLMAANRGDDVFVYATVDQWISTCRVFFYVQTF